MPKHYKHIPKLIPPVEALELLTSDTVRLEALEAFHKFMFKPEVCFIDLAAREAMWSLFREFAAGNSSALRMSVGEAIENAHSEGKA